MKGRTSSLNPYATSYVPLCRRGVADDNKAHESTENGYPNGNHSSTQSQYQKSSQNYNAPRIAEDSRPTGQMFYGSSSQNPNEVTEKNEEYDMDLAYLLMMFPGISDESLSDVYKANSCDLEATVDMLYELEHSENLAETEDVSDASGTVSSTSAGLAN